MLKALLDTRLAEHLDKAETRSHIEHLGGASLERIQQNLTRAEADLEKHYSSFHYSLVKLKYPNHENPNRHTRKHLTHRTGPPKGYRAASHTSFQTL